MVGIPSKRSDTAATGDPALGWQGPREVKGLLPRAAETFPGPFSSDTKARAQHLPLQAGLSTGPSCSKSRATWLPSTGHED